MTNPELDVARENDLLIVLTCARNPNQKAWGAFFRHFESRFRLWIRNTLRDSSDADHEDVYQIFAAELLAGKILAKIDTGRDPTPYLHKCVRNCAWEYHERATNHLPESFDDETIPMDRLRLVADHASPVREDELYKRLYAALLDSDIGEKQIQTFLTLSEHKKLKDIARETHFSKSAVGRYVEQLEVFCYDALGVPFPQRKKVK